MASEEEVEDEEDELDAEAAIDELDAESLFGGEGVRARTSTTFNSADADDGSAEEEEEEASIEFTAPESERRTTPSESFAGPEGGDDDLERGTDSTTFKVEGVDDDTEALEDAESEDIVVINDFD